MNRKQNKKTVRRKIRMDEKYLEKDACMKSAQTLMEKYHWTKVTTEQLPKEIYGHAYVYYRWKWMEKLPVANRLVYSHAADGIDVTDKVDSFQPVWEWIWKYK